MQVKLNPNWSKEKHKLFTQKIKDNDGHCPCMIIKNRDTKCICKDFRKKMEDDNFHGECHCGRYVKE